MPQNTENIAFRFLNELHSKENQKLFEMLDYLLEELENKPDPDPKELRIVDMTYQTVEKLKMLESLLKDYAQGSGKLDGTKLQDLYDKIPSGTGSQALFD